MLGDEDGSASLPLRGRPSAAPDAAKESQKGWPLTRLVYLNDPDNSRKGYYALADRAGDSWERIALHELCLAYLKLNKYSVGIRLPRSRVTTTESTKVFSQGSTGSIIARTVLTSLIVWMKSVHAH